VIAKRLDKARHIIFPILTVVAIIVLHEATSISRWVLIVPVLLVTFVLIAVWERVLKRGGESNGRP
jgi:membrane protein implicated in regulation of membrane protease activity